MHGEGKYYVSGGGVGDGAAGGATGGVKERFKKGIWENGKRVKWI